MAKFRTIKAAGINVRLHTKHDPSEYKRLWEMLYRQKYTKTRGYTALMIGDMRHLNNEDESSPIVGYFYRFVNIDPSDPWFDIESQKKAKPGDVAQVVIPKNLKPSLMEIPYVFDLKKHKLYFQ